MNPSPPIESLSYENALAELEAIVAALEAGEQPLDETLALYERGQALARHCAALLNQADLKLRQISDNELVDFENA
jgi:exodeoxyribonuclease VII small subunit